MAWLRRLTLAMLLLGAAMVAAADTIELTLPAFGAETAVLTRPGVDYALDAETLRHFSHGELEDDDLVLRFTEDRRIRLRDWLAAGEERATLVLDGQALPGAEALLVGLETAAPASGLSAGPGAGGVSPDHRQTARKLLFRGEDEGPAFGFHSYLLFASAAADGPALERRRAALEAYFSEVSAVEGLLKLGVAKREINVLWLPLRVPEGRSREDLRTRANGPQARGLVPIALSHYDFARARVLLGRLGLQGNGPWIVSYPRPLRPDAAPANPDMLLVQDLSRAPPQLVRAWVQAFKRRLEGEPNGLGARLNGFFLALRTEIANLAEGLSITREAVAMTLGEEAEPRADVAPAEPPAEPREAPPGAHVSSAAAAQRWRSWRAGVAIQRQRQHAQLLYDARRLLGRLQQELQTALERGATTRGAVLRVQIAAARIDAEQAMTALPLDLAEAEWPAMAGGVAPSLTPGSSQRAALPADLDQAIKRALQAAPATGAERGSGETLPGITGAVRRAWLGHRYHAEAVESLEPAVASSAKIKEDWLQQFQLGQRRLDELLGVLEQDLELRRRLIDHQSAALEAMIELLRLTGRVEALPSGAP